ncbi:MAG: PrsW family glutamic-type intramembrane protease [Lachnospiraceae bacterium]
MLLGGAIGAGFAVFESVGYSFNNFLAGAISIWGFSMADGFDHMMFVTMLRAVLAPGGHVAWAAIEGAAIMAVLGDEGFSVKFLTDKRFLSMTLICIALHTVWDWDDPVSIGVLSYAKLGILITIAWIVILVLLNLGLKQLNDKIKQAEGGE